MEECYKFASEFHIYLIHFHDMEEELINKIIADGFQKLDNKLDPNSNSNIEIEWRIMIEQNGGVKQCLNV